MDLIKNNLLYIPASIAIITELFPDLGLSYWYPSDKSIYFYDNMEFFRWMAVIFTWVPIIITLYKISSIEACIAAVFIMISFYINRNSTWKTKLANTSAFHFIGFVIIYHILIQKEKDETKRIILLVYIALLLLGGAIISNNRRRNRIKDYIGRIIFSIGFYKFIDTLIHIS
jgi:hypothetical protein